MGEPRLDLPNPLRDDPPPAPVIGTDDLLLQLAGEEIDRLIGDIAAVKPPEKPEDQPPAIEPEMRPIEEVAENIQEQLDELLAEVDLTPLPEFGHEFESQPNAMSDAERHELTGEPSPREQRQAAPSYLKPLAWLNAPVLWLPAKLQFIAGIAAVIIFVAAVATLTYVLILIKG